MSINPLKRPSFRRLVLLVKSHPRRSLVITGAVLILITGGVTYAILSQPLPELPKVATPKPKPRPVSYYSSLTGLKVANKAAVTAPVTAIMIENSPDARPQSGLKDAEIVYEAVAEGGITRFLALYQQNKPQLIGPVRSVRPYYVDWAVPYNASIAHVGGSAVALREIRNGNYRDIDQFFNAETYWRVSDRYAPHNVYTSFEKLDAINRSKGYTSSAPQGFARTDVKPSKTPNAKSMSVRISSTLFDSSYSYDPANNYYVRSQGGAPHEDREKGTITPKVVIVLNVASSSEFQDTTREVIQTTGSGAVTVFQAGTATQGTWSRSSSAKQYTFTDSTGKPIKLDRGQTWITAIPNGNGSVTWQ